MTNGRRSESASVRRLLLVVGIGRSGTSLLATILGRLGFRVPQPEVKADETNPRGFGEPRWVVDFHTRLMRERRVTVFDSRPAAWDATAETANHDEVVDELRSWLAVQFVGADNVVVKDPRIGWFLPLWLRCADDLGVRTTFATLLRYPPEVVESARRAYGTWQSDGSRAAAWLNVTLHAERATRGSPRAFVRYPDLLEDWSREISRTAVLLDLPWLVGIEASAYPSVEALVDPRLARSNVGWDAVAVPHLLQEMVDDVWQQVSRLADQGGEDDATRASLDAARAAYTQFYADAEAISQSSVTAVKPRRFDAATADTHAARTGRAHRSRTPLPVRIARRIPRRYRERLPAGLRRAALRGHDGVPLPLRVARSIPRRHRERVLVAGFRFLYALPSPMRSAALEAGRRAARALSR